MTALTDAAQAEAERQSRVAHPQIVKLSGDRIDGDDTLAYRRGFLAGAKWQAGQEPTEAEVRAVMKVCREFYSTPVSVGPQFALAVLSAARAAYTTGGTA